MTTYVRDNLFRANQASEDSLIRDVLPSINLFTELRYKAPLFLVLNKMGKKRTVFNMKFECFDDDIAVIKTEITGDVTVSGTAANVAVSEKGVFKAGDTIWNATQNEHGRVSSAVTGTGAGNVPVVLTNGSGAWKKDDVVISLGFTAQDGGSDPQAIMHQLTSRYNYCETTQTSVSLTDIARKSKQYGGSREAHEKKKKIIEHTASLEAKLLFGIRDTGTETTEWWTSGGLLDPNIGIDSENIFDCSGATFDYADMEYEFLRGIWTKGGSEKKMAFCSPDGAILLNKIYGEKHTLNVSPKDQITGFATRTIQHALGQLEIVPHFMLTPDRYGSKWGNMILIVDPTYMGLVSFADEGGMKWHENRQANNVRYKSDMILTTQGFELQLDDVHGVIHNFVLA